VAGWLGALVLAVVAWVGWRAYDHRAAIREAKSLGWEWRSEGPLELIRQDWRVAFQRETWKRKASVEIPRDFASHSQLIHRLNPTRLTVWNDGDLASLAGLSHLEDLKIDFLWGKAEASEMSPDVSGLKNLPKLEVLHLSRRGVKNLNGLSEFKTLKRITVTNCPDLQNLQGLSDLPALEFFEVNGCAIADLTGLKQLPKLTAVGVQGCPNLQTLKDLAAAEALQMLLISECPQLQGVDVIAGLANLEEVRLFRCTSLENYAVFKALKKLKRLEIYECPKFSTTAAQDLSSARPGLVIDAAP
jgi:hypothetical protein